MADPAGLSGPSSKSVTPTLETPDKPGNSPESIRAEQTIRREFRREVTISIGPLPPPEVLKEYNEVFPGCAERIVKMAEGQAAHRQHLEKTVITANVGNERLGMILGFILCGIALVGGLGLLALGKSVAGFTVILSDIAALAGSTIYLRYRQGKERQEKLEAFQSDVPPQAPTPERPS